RKFPRLDVYLCAGDKTLWQIRRRIVTGIQNWRTHASLRGYNTAQLVTQLTEIVTRRIALAVPGKQTVGTSYGREKEETRHPSISANLGNEKRRAVAVIDQQDSSSPVNFFFYWNS